MDLEGAGHAPHPLVGGQDLLITNQNAVWVFHCERIESQVIEGAQRGEKLHVFC